MLEWLTKKCTQDNTFAWALTGIGITLIVLIALL